MFHGSSLQIHSSTCLFHGFGNSRFRPLLCCLFCGSRSYRPVANIVGSQAEYQPYNYPEALPTKWPWVISHASMMGRMNAHVQPILMFTRGTGLWPTAIWACLGSTNIGDANMVFYWLPFAHSKRGTNSKKDDSSRSLSQIGAPAKIDGCPFPGSPRAV